MKGAQRRVNRPHSFGGCGLSAQIHYWLYGRYVNVHDQSSLLWGWEHDSPSSSKIHALIRCMHTCWEVLIFMCVSLEGGRSFKVSAGIRKHSVPKPTTRTKSRLQIGSVPPTISEKPLQVIQTPLWVLHVVNNDCKAAIYHSVYTIMKCSDRMLA